MSQKNNHSLAQEIAQLDELASWFEQDDFDLEEALVKFEETTKVADSIDEKLTKIENKITVLKARFDEE